MPLGLRPRGILSLLGTLYPIEHSRSLSNPYLLYIVVTICLFRHWYASPKVTKYQAYHYFMSSSILYINYFIFVSLCRQVLSNTCRQVTITVTSTLIIPDIAKTSSNNCLLYRVMSVMEQKSAAPGKSGML